MGARAKKIIVGFGLVWVGLVVGCTTPTPASRVSDDGTNDGTHDATNDGTNNATNNATNDATDGRTNDDVPCLAGCSGECHSPGDPLCGSDGQFHCNDCELDCLGLDRVEPWRCEPSGEGVTPLGHGCDSTEECAVGLACHVVYAGPACEPQSSACDALCGEDSDCDGFGENTVCAMDCLGRRACRVRATSDLPLGASCTSTPQCSEGLTCLALSTGDPCQEFARICTLPCGGDDACAPFDPRGACFRQCDGRSVCGLFE